MRNKIKHKRKYIKVMEEILYYNKYKYISEEDRNKLTIYDINIRKLKEKIIKLFANYNNKTENVINYEQVTGFYEIDGIKINYVCDKDLFKVYN